MERDQESGFDAELEQQSETSAIPTQKLELQDFLLEVADRESGYYTKVYRRTGSSRHNNVASFLQTFHNAIPTEEELAETYGPGRYELRLLYSDRKGKRQGRSQTINIDPSCCGPEFAQGGQAVPQAPAQPSSAQMGFTPAHMIAMFDCSMKTIAAFAGKQSNGGDSSMADSVIKIMEAAAMNHLDLIDTAARKRIGAPDNEDEEGAAGDSILGMLMGVWKMLGPKLFSMSAEAMRGAAGGIRESDDVKHLLEHPDEYVEVLETFHKETGVERVKIAELLTKVGLPTPDELVEKRDVKGAA